MSRTLERVRRRRGPARPWAERVQVDDLAAALARATTFSTSMNAVNCRPYLSVSSGVTRATSARSSVAVARASTARTDRGPATCG